MKNNLLVLSAYLPRSDARQAGHYVAYKNISNLSKNYNVTLISFKYKYEKIDSDLDSICKKIILIDTSVWNKLNNIIRNIHLPVHVSVKKSPTFLKKIHKELSRTEFHNIHLEWGQMASYTEYLPSSTKISIFLHDIIYQSSLRKTNTSNLFKKIFYYIEYKRLAAWEKYIYPKINKLFFVSKKDSLLINCKSNNSNIIVPSFKKYKRDEITNTVPTILFYGSYLRTENTTAALYLIDKVYPLLKKKFNNLKLIIAGSNPPQSLIAKSSKNIQITGYSKNLTEIFNKCSIAILPLYFGAGVKIKVYECLSSGIPVVTSEIGAEGIECGKADGLIVVDMHDPEKYAAEASALLSDLDKLKIISKKSIHWGQKYYQLSKRELSI